MGVGTVCFVNRSTMNVNIRRTEMSHFDIALPKDRELWLTLDQSSSRTGFYCTDNDQSFHLIGDLDRRGGDKENFYQDMYFFFKKLTLGVNLKWLIREQLPPIKSNYATPVLQQLIGRINSWRAPGQGGIPAFAAVPESNYDEIHPGTWKKHVLDKSKGKGRSNKKREIALDLVDKFPELQKYFNYYPASSDYDGFDALGIYTGYRAEMGSLDAKQIMGSQSYSGDICVYYRLATDQQMEDRNFFLDGFWDVHGKTNVQLLDMNAGRTFYENVNMAASSHPFVASVIDDSDYDLMIRILFGMPLDRRRIFVYIIRKTHITKRQREKLDEMYANEMVTW